LDLLFRRFEELDRFSGQIADFKGALSKGEKRRVGIKQESDLTMRSYKGERTFRNSMGSAEVFEEHVWIDQHNRIHLIIRDEKPRIEIGYVGIHLRTWSD
jgi:hypothetical protein